MKTAEDFIKEYWDVDSNFIEKVRENMSTMPGIDFDNIPDLMLAYAKEAIKADRIELLKNIKLSFTPYDEEEWEEVTNVIKREDILEFYGDGEDDEWAAKKIIERDGFEISIDEDSIINAPNINLL